MSQFGGDPPICNYDIWFNQIRFHFGEDSIYNVHMWIGDFYINIHKPIIENM